MLRGTRMIDYKGDCGLVGLVGSLTVAFCCTYGVAFVRMYDMRVDITILYYATLGYEWYMD